ncbi:MAG: pentapeptide repeat-containing protein [Alphaproteobacteria bacterium]|nr:pentapeptide repeat-containing protein [Alphaproteobacteria bacterium]
MPKGPPPKDVLDWLGLTRDPDWRVARPLGAVFGALLILSVPALFLAALVAAFVSLYHVILGSAALGSPSSNGLGASTLIVALLSAPFLVWRTIIAHRTLGFQKEGHITDRISKAVEQLGAEKTVKRQLVNSHGTKVFKKHDDGSIDDATPVLEEVTVPNIEVRIGAILSLERIAQDSVNYDKGRDHVRVMEILCAYIPENAPAASAQGHAFGEWLRLDQAATKKERAAHEVKRRARFGSHYSEGLVHKWARSLPPPREDIALALKVLGRRDAAQRQVEARWGKDAAPDATWVFDEPVPSLPDQEEPFGTAILDDYAARLGDWKDRIRSYRGYRLDLHHTNLQGADLSGLVLSGALLHRARLQGASLIKARLQGAFLRNARLGGAYLREVQMEGAILDQAQLEGASLMQAEMTGASLQGARLNGTSLLSTRATGANFGGTQLEVANFLEARLERVWLDVTGLEGACLRGTKLEGAYISNAQVDGVEFYGARLTGAALQNVNLTSAGITQDRIESCFGDATVIVPPGRSRPAHWPLWDLSHQYINEWRKWRADPANYVPPPPSATQADTTEEAGFDDQK